MNEFTELIFKRVVEANRVFVKMNLPAHAAGHVTASAYALKVGIDVGFHGNPPCEYHYRILVVGSQGKFGTEKDAEKGIVEVDIFRVLV